MQILYACENIVSECLNLDHNKMNWALEELLQIRLAVFSHNIQSVKVIVILRLNDLADADEIGMVQNSQKMNFSQNALAINIVFENTC